jgi:hypothetical protein
MPPQSPQKNHRCNFCVNAGVIRIMMMKIIFARAQSLASRYRGGRSHPAI